jgi:hypothetical protein
LKFTPAKYGEYTITASVDSGDPDFHVYNSLKSAEEDSFEATNSSGSIIAATNSGTYEFYTSTFDPATTYYIKVYNYSDFGSEVSVKITQGTEPGGGGDIPEQPYVNANLSATTLDDDIRFDLSFSYNNSDSYIEGAIAKLVNNDTGTTVVSSHRISLNGAKADVADTTFLAQDIYDKYEQNVSYTLTIYVYENIPEVSIWDTVTTTFVWPFNSGGEEEGGRDLSSRPIAYFTGTSIYVSNYVGSEWSGLDVDIEVYYNGEYQGTDYYSLGSNGYVQGASYDTSGEWSFYLTLHDRPTLGEETHSERVSVWTDY